MSDSVLPWFAIAVLLFWAMGAYNRLVRCRSQGLLVFTALEALLHQHLLLVKTHAPDAQGASAPTFWAQSDAAGLSAWAGFAAAADQFRASLRVAHAHPLHAPAMRALKTAHETMSDSWTRVRSLPAELTGPVWLKALQSDWESLALKTDMARTDFNRAVSNYNEAIGQFPALLLAWLFGFKPAQSI